MRRPHPGRADARSDGSARPLTTKSAFSNHGSGRELRNDAPEMTLVESDNMIEAVTSQCVHKSLNNGLIDAHRVNAFSKLATDETRGSRVSRKTDGDRTFTQASRHRTEPRRPAASVALQGVAYGLDA